MGIKNKKATELSLQTIIVLIIILITFIVLIYFFVTHYGSNSDSLIDVGNNVIGGAAELT